MRQVRGASVSGLALLVVLSLPGLSPLARGSGLDLVADGKSDYRIVIPAAAEAPERFAAEELSRYLAQITGVRLPIVSAAEKGVGRQLILVGQAAPHGVWLELSQQPEDSFILRTADGQLILAGACPRSTLFAVYTFLETLGVGFPRPGQSYLLSQLEQPVPEEETIPKLATLRVPELNRVEKPAFNYRAIMLFPFIKERSIREIDWAAKNRLNWVHIATNNTREEQWKTHRVREEVIPEIVKRGLGLQGIGHSFYAFIDPAKYGKEHPEYFAEGDGKRVVEDNRGGLCVTNPEVIRLMSENMSAFLRENPEIDIIDLWTNDSAAWCYCRACKESQGVPADFKGPYTTTTRSYLRFVNEVARRLAKDHPRIQVNALAYARNRVPDPEIKPAANVMVGIAPWERCTYGGSDDYYVPITEPSRVNGALLQNILGWVKLTGNFYLYDYYGNRSEFFPIMDTLRKDYAYYKKAGIDMVSTEPFLWPEFNMWAYPRLAWDHTIPVPQLINEFCRVAYRGSAEPMVEFHTILEDNKWEWPKQRPKLEALLAKALEQAKASKDPNVVSKMERLAVILKRDATKTWPHENPPPRMSK